MYGLTIYDRFRHKADMPTPCHNILLGNSITANTEHINHDDNANTIIYHSRGICMLFYIQLHPQIKAKADTYAVH